MPSNRNIIIAVCGSVALHGFLLSLIHRDVLDSTGSIRDTKRSTLPLQLNITANRNLEPVTLAEFQPLTEQPSDIQPAVISQAISAPSSPPPIPPPQGRKYKEPTERAAPDQPVGERLAQQLLGSIRQADPDSARKAFLSGSPYSPSCTPAERHGGIRNCPPPDIQQVDAHSAFYAALFKQSFAHVLLENPSFSKDMAAVDRLIAQADQLASTQPVDAVQAAFMREQSHHIQQEVLRIDQRYTQFNLLRLIPIGVKAFKGLQTESSDS